MNTFSFAALFLAAAATTRGADWTNSYSGFGQLIVTNLASAPFPHPQRAEGHTYQGKLYAADPHYRDDTVAIFIPENFRAGAQVDFVVHFHGWFNHVSKTLADYKLIEQFVESRRNAVLVVPEGPRDAPDSFGGKLEDRDGFKRFMADVLAALRAEPRFGRAELGDIILSGHSGGYHVTAFILAQGGLPERVKEVWLFDALYGQTEKFTAWQSRFHGRLLNIYTEHGGTKEETEKLMADLKSRAAPFFAGKDTEAKPEDLRTHALVFLSTDLAHDDVLAKRKTFRRFLEASGLAEIWSAKSASRETPSKP
jgi:hypothetical protein